MWSPAVQLRSEVYVAPTPTHEPQSSLSCVDASVSVPFFTPHARPDSYYEKIKANRQNSFHTLCLLGTEARPPAIPSPVRSSSLYHIRYPRQRTDTGKPQTVRVNTISFYALSLISVSSRAVLAACCKEIARCTSPLGS